MSQHIEREHGPCPFDWGDRVDHTKFGLGTIVSRPVPASGPITDPSAPSHYSIGPKGWTLEIEWDDPNRPRGKFSSIHFRVVERPDAKGSTYWMAIYRDRLGDTLDARRRTETLMKQAFRSSDGGPNEVRAALDQERAAIDGLLAFLDADEVGEHH